jgi:uncharacterized protein YjiS (DUF1127 family)
MANIPEDKKMDHYAERSLYCIESRLDFPVQERPAFRRLRGVFAALYRAAADRSRRARERKHMMTDHQLRDIGFRRIGTGQVMHIVPIDETAASLRR